MNLEDGEAIVQPWISKAIETAQKKVEARNYDIRKQVVEFDDVMNDQRKVIYEQRADIMDAETVDARWWSTCAPRRSGARWSTRCPPGTYPEQWTSRASRKRELEVLRLRAADRRVAARRKLSSRRLLVERHPGAGRRRHGRQGRRACEPEQLDPGREEHPAPDPRSSLEGASGDARRAPPVIHLRSYAQKKPIDEYKQEAFLLFERLLIAIREEVTRTLAYAASFAAAKVAGDAGLRHQPHRSADRAPRYVRRGCRLTRPCHHTRAAVRCAADRSGDARQRSGGVDGPVSRNALCPCGSSEKYKHCHGRTARPRLPTGLPDQSVAAARRNASTGDAVRYRA